MRIFDKETYIKALHNDMLWGTPEECQAEADREPWVALCNGKEVDFSEAHTPKGMGFILVDDFKFGISPDWCKET